MGADTEMVHSKVLFVLNGVVVGGRGLLEVVAEVLVGSSLAAAGE